MKFPKIAAQIIQLKDEDLAMRNRLIQSGELSKGYHPEMAALHNRNADALDKIMQKIGFPTISLVGKVAMEANWLIIQHAIGQPDFMRKCAQLLAVAVSKNEASSIQLAYLTDRIAVFEGKLQHYGTQFDWDENGELTPQAYDNLAKVNERRKSVGLNSLEEQTKIIRQQAIEEKQTPPLNAEARKRVYDEWRRTVGWIN